MGGHLERNLRMDGSKIPAQFRLPILTTSAMERDDVNLKAKKILFIIIHQPQYNYYILS